MSHFRVLFITAFFLTASISFGQVETVSIVAGTPEDKELTAISNEQDVQKKIPMYQDFLQKYAANPMAVAFANWQLAQAYQSAGDLPKALEAGDKALAASPRNLDMLSTQVATAQQMHDNARAFQYCIRGGDVYNSIATQTKPANITSEDFQSSIQVDQNNNKNTYQFFQNTAFSVIAGENDAKARMNYIDKYTATFPKSSYDDQITSYAMMSLAEMRDNKRLIAYAEKILAGNPEDLPALIMLANTYVENPEAAAKAITYAQKALTVAKADDPNADTSRKVSAGVAHGVIGRAYANQGKNLPSIAELKAAMALLKDHDDQQYAVAAYFLGWNYAKLNKLADARAVLTEAAQISGPMQAPTKELLTKVESAHGGRK